MRSSATTSSGRTRTGSSSALRTTPFARSELMRAGCSAPPGTRLCSAAMPARRRACSSERWRSLPPTSVGWGSGGSTSPAPSRTPASSCGPARCSEISSTTAREAGDLELELHGLIEQSFLRLYMGSGEVDEFLAIAARADEAFKATDNDGGLAAAWNLVAHAHFVECRVEPMEEALRTAIPYADRAGDRRLVGYFRIALARAALVGPTPVEQGLERCDEVLRGGQRGPAPRGRRQWNRRVLGGDGGRVRRGAAAAARSSDILAELGMTVSVGRGRTWWGAIELLAGKPAAAEMELRAGVATLQEIGEIGNLAYLVAA